MHPPADPHLHLRLHAQQHDRAVLGRTADARATARCSPLRSGLATSVRRLGAWSLLELLARRIDCLNASLPMPA